ncbi:NAD(+)/NADH kinase [Halarchaeum salinum]|uniref:ATP-NAD kinase n=1 Tax=Halarchaeum salinum TaxID=489912 RepID=A0AAV3S981_9EURY
MTEVHVGLVGPEAESAAAVVENAGGTATVGDTDATVVLDDGVEAVAAFTESALYDLVHAGVAADTPVLPLNVGTAIDAVTPADRDRALRRLVRGEYDERERPTIAVEARRETYRALSDVMLATAEAARISEYAIEARGENGVGPVDTVRADGVAVATPLGSGGYTATADGPVLSPTVEAVAVVPIAPFRVECPNWVVSLPGTLTVERDETDVALLIDDTDVGHVQPGAPVDISYGEPVTLAAMTES